MNGHLQARKDKRKLHKDLIEVIVYFAARKQKEIPGIKRVLLSAIILASCEFVSNGKETCHHFGNNRSWEEKVTRRFCLIIDEFGDFLHPDLKEMLYNISEFRKKMGYNGRYGNIFYDFFELHSDNRNQPTIQLPTRFNRRVERDVLSELDLSLVIQCKAIGELTVKYLKRDLRKIKERKTNPR